MTDDSRQRDRRERMVASLLRNGAVRDPRVVAALGKVPRHRFVAPNLIRDAYGRHALPIGEGQTISQPSVVARMTELLEVRDTDVVLEIGTGSGYQTAILAELARRVYSLERFPSLARRAIARMRELNVLNVKIQDFDGSGGWPEMAPFDRVLVTAGAPALPAPLATQLAPGGRMVIPEGSREEQSLAVYELDAGGNLRRTDAGPAAFVPLVGDYGWESG